MNTQVAATPTAAATNFTWKNTSNEGYSMNSIRQAITALRRRWNGFVRRAGVIVSALAPFAPPWIALIVACVGLASASAATLTVTNTSDSGAGSLRAAIASAGVADTIIFDAALSGGMIYLATTLDLTNNVTIDGSALATPITLSGDTDNNGVGNVGVFYVLPGVTATLDSLNITKGFVNGFGGGIKSFGTLTVTNSTLSGNSGYYGGGISSSGGSTLTLTHSTLSGNSGTYGGGIYNGGGPLTITDSVLSNNSAANTGGGIYALFNNPFTMMIVNSTLLSNVSATSGGGIFSAGTLAITNTSLAGNSALAGSGGGIWSGAPLTLNNSTLSGNSVSDNGGAIYSSRALTVTNSTLAGNTAAGSGGGIYVYETTAKIYNTSIVFNGADADANLIGSAGGIYNNDGLAASSNLHNTLVAGNTIGNGPVYNDCAGTLHSYGRNLFWDVTGCTVSTDSGIWTYLNALNLLGPLQNNGGPTMTLALLPGSNAIDGGDPALGCIDDNGNPLTTDQRGMARVLGSTCDIGAFEYDDVIFANGFD
jgi:predicted outer membrane repeat protein